MSVKSHRSFSIKYSGKDELIVRKNNKASFLLACFVAAIFLGFTTIVYYFVRKAVFSFPSFLLLIMLGFVVISVIRDSLKAKKYVFDKVHDQFKYRGLVLQKLSEVKCIELVGYPERENPNIFRLYLVGPNDYTFHWLDIGSDEMELMAVAGELSKFLGVPVVKVENEKWVN